MKCRYCGCTSFSYKKKIQWGPSQGKTFHYQAKCKECRKIYYIPRTREVYEKVKDFKWEISKATIKNLRKHGLTIKDLY